MLKKFVCVRIVQANGLDLSLFQFDYDLTFAAFLLNADRTIYGRFGSRSEQQHAEKDISLEGFRKALAGALELHQHYPANKASLAGKQPLPVKMKRPEDYASLSGKYPGSIEFTGKVARTCIHCHQVREAERLLYRENKEPLPDKTLYPWPMPTLVGLSLDPKEKAKVTEVSPGSPAEKAGFKFGDEILHIQGGTSSASPILSIADVQWVLQNAPSEADLGFHIRRASGGTSSASARPGEQDLTLYLPQGWRLKNDIGWRSSTWDLRRMGTGGLVLKEASADERQKNGLRDNDLALLVEYGEHAAGKRAGFQKGDIITRVDDHSNRMTESELLGYLLQNKNKTDQAAFTVLRSGNKLDLKLALQ